MRDQADERGIVGLNHVDFRHGASELALGLRDRRRRAGLRVHDVLLLFVVVRAVRFHTRWDNLLPVDTHGQAAVRWRAMSSWARVLVADDHQPMLRLLAAMLAREFVVVEAVSEGGQLVDAEARLNPDVIVADISMPVMSGL